MRKNYFLPAKCTAWAMALSLTLASAPDMLVRAEDGITETSVFVITDFPDFAKDDSGNYIDTQMTELYGNLTAFTGTSLSSLGLPTDLTVVGYMELEGPEAVREPFDFTDMIWKLKSDTGEVYSESTAAGTYTFVPDFEEYTSQQISAGTAVYDEIRLADGLKAPELTVTIQDEETEPSTEAYTEEPVPEDLGAGDPAADNPEWTDPAAEDPGWTDPAADNPEWTDPSADGSDPSADSWETEIWTDSPSDNGWDDSGEDPNADVSNEGGDDDIFSGINDDLLDSDEQDTYNVDNPYQVQAPGPVIIDEGSDDGNSDGSQGPEAVPAEENNDGNLVISIVLTDAQHAGDITDPDYTLTLVSSPTETDNIARIDLPCDSPLDITALTPLMYDGNGAQLTVKPVAAPDDSGAWNFAETPEAAYMVINSGITSYNMTLNVTKADHQWADGDCTTPKTCSVCGATEGEAPGHNWTEATCTEPKTCSVCGATEGEPLGHQWTGASCTSSGTCSVCGAENPEPAPGHQWADASCDTPRTCLVCGETEGEAPGHDWADATCTTPKTCKRCGKVEGEALGHDWTAATCTTPKTCKRCGKVEGEALGHDWTAATCTTPKTCKRCGKVDGGALGHDWAKATCTAPKTCKRCGKVDGKALGHDWEAATCTTPKTCKRCGKVEGEALGHDWVAATCTTPKICKRCKLTEGKALGHKWKEATCTEPKTCETCKATEGTALGHEWANNWIVSTASTDTVHGQEIRYCTRAQDASETRQLNIIGDPSRNSINGLSDGGTYDLNTVLTFSATGSAMGNSAPINGDVRYVPSSWTVQNTPGTFRDGYTGSFSITQSGRYTITVTYQKQEFTDGWQNTNIVDTKSITITVGNVVSATPTDGNANGVRINPQTGDNTPIIALVVALIIAAAAIVAMIVFKKKKSK